MSGELSQGAVVRLGNVVKTPHQDRTTCLGAGLSHQNLTTPPQRVKSCQTYELRQPRIMQVACTGSAQQLLPHTFAVGDNGGFINC
jgi:hypothetical protein